MTEERATSLKTKKRNEGKYAMSVVQLELAFFGLALHHPKIGQLEQECIHLAKLQIQQKWQIKGLRQTDNNVNKMERCYKAISSNLQLGLCAVAGGWIGDKR